MKHFLFFFLLGAVPAWPAMAELPSHPPTAGEDRAAAEQLHAMQDAVARLPAPEHEAALTVLLTEIRRLEGGGLLDRLRRRLADPNPALGRQLAQEYFRSWSLLQAWQRADEPTPTLHAVADLIHLEGDHPDLLAVLRNYTFDGWYQRYLLRRLRALAERLPGSSPRLAENLIHTVIRVTKRGNTHALALERMLLAGLSHEDGGTRLSVLRFLLPGGNIRWPAVGALFRTGDALRARIEAMRENDPSPAVQQYFQSYPPTVPVPPPIAETAAPFLAPPPEGGEWIETPRYRSRAVASLFALPGSIGSAVARDRLLALLHGDPSEAVRWRVVQSLFDHRQEDPRYFPALLHALHHDPSAAIRRAIAGKLEPFREEDRAVAVALSRAYVQRRIPDRREGWDCRDIIRFEGESFDGYF